MNQFIKRLKFVKWTDICHIFLMLVGLACSLYIRLLHRHIWLVCERKEDARDNGYWFFKYLCECHPEIEAVYAIDFDSPDYNKVASLGTVIPFASLKHWIYYWAAEKNISSQKEGKPNAALCYILEVYLGCRKNRVFLQHGIIMSDLRWLYYDVTKMNLFICAGIPEYEYVKSRFGYPEGVIQLCGLSRFDNLEIEHTIKRQILVMPTHREWLAVKSSNTLKYEGTYNFIESEYFKAWNSLLHSKKLYQLLENFNYDLLFFPHAAMQQYVGYFEDVNERIKIGTAKDNDVQQLLMESSLLITDYSSINVDFAYMKKPLIYYQFDYEKFREYQYREGYFSYEKDGFGPVAVNENQLLENLEEILTSDLKMDSRYLARTQEFYAFHDNKNRERTYLAILNMNNKR